MSAGEELIACAHWGWARLAGAYLFPYMSSAWRPEICGTRCCCGCHERLSQTNAAAGLAVEEPGWPKLPLFEKGCVQPPQGGLDVSKSSDRPVLGAY